MGRALLAASALLAAVSSTAREPPGGDRRADRLDVAIEEWSLPAPGSLPHDPAVAPDGSLWYTAQKANRLGRLDPVTGRIAEYELPTPGSGPHGLTVDRAGDVWYTGNSAGIYSDYGRGSLGRLDPGSGEVREWASPGGPSSKPYGIAITADGMVWYSESGVEPNTVVRFDPRAQRFARADIPSGGGVVRNMAAAPDGRVYIACSGANKVGVVAQR
jgi:virginiamycin B lyase